MTQKILEKAKDLDEQIQQLEAAISSKSDWVGISCMSRCSGYGTFIIPRELFDDIQLILKTHLEYLKKQLAEL